MTFDSSGVAQNHVDEPRSAYFRGLAAHHERTRIEGAKVAAFAEELVRLNPEARLPQIHAQAKKRMGRGLPRGFRAKRIEILKGLGHVVSGRGVVMRDGHHAPAPLRLRQPGGGTLETPPARKRPQAKGDVRAAASLLLEAMKTVGGYRTITVHSDGRVEAEVVRVERVRI